MLALGCPFSNAAPWGQSWTKSTGCIRLQCLSKHTKYIPWLLTKTSKHHFDCYLIFCTTLRPTPAFIGAFRFWHCWKACWARFILIFATGSDPSSAPNPLSAVHWLTYPFIYCRFRCCNPDCRRWISWSIKLHLKTRHKNIAVWNADSSELPGPALRY